MCGQYLSSVLRNKQSTSVKVYTVHVSTNIDLFSLVFRKKVSLTLHCTCTSESNSNGAEEQGRE